MAEGRSNAAIAQRLVVTEHAVAIHTASIVIKLDLQPSDDDNRRVLAVLTYLDRWSPVHAASSRSIVRRPMRLIGGLDST